MCVNQDPSGPADASGEPPTPRAPREGDRIWISIRGSVDGEAIRYWCVYRAASGTWEQEVPGKN